MADDVFKLPQSSYDTVCKIIQAYAQVGDKTSLSTVSKILGTDTTVVSRNVGFLVSVGILEGARDKGPTPAGARLGRALEFDRADDIAASWREVLTEHTLIQRVLSAIRVRGGMEASALQSQVVYTAGVNKTSGTITGGGAVLEMLKAANLVTERDGRFIVTSATEQSVEEAPAEVELPPTAVVQRVIETSEDGGVSVRIDLRVEVRVTVDELPAVGKGIRDLMAELRRSDQSDGGEGHVLDGSS